MFTHFQNLRLACAYRVCDEMNDRGRPSRVCFWAFLQCVLSVLAYPADLWSRISYRILCWRIATGRVKPLKDDDDIPF